MAKLEGTFPCLPLTQRGRGILIAGDPNTDTIAYANGKSIILRSLANPLTTDVYNEHSYPTTIARFSPNGEWVASGDASGIVRIWARGGDHVLKFESRALAGSIDDLQWSADGLRIVVSGDGKGSVLVRAFMWDSGSNVGEFDGHSKRVLSCSIRPTRPFRVVSCGEDFQVNYYEGPPFRFKASHRDHTNFVNCVRYSPDGSKYVSVGSDKAGIIYEGGTGQPSGKLSTEGGHTGSIYALSWSPDSKQMLTASADKTAKVWDVAEDGSGATVATTFAFGTNPVPIDFMQVSALWLNNRLVTVSLNGDINILDPASPEQPALVLQGHIKYITALAIAEEGGEQEIYTSSYDGLIVRWKEGKGCLGRVQGKGHASSVAALAVVNGELLSIGLDDTFRRSPLPLTEYSGEGLPLGAQPTGMAAAPGVVLISTVKGLTIIHGSSIASTIPTAFDATAVALSPDGSQAAVGSKDGKIRIYAVTGDTLTESATLERHRGPITAIRFSPNGALFASADQNREALVWDAVSHEVKVKNMLYHTARISTLAWAPDSSRLATGSLDTNVIVWDVEKPASERLTIKGAHPGGVTAVAFRTPTSLVSAGDDASLRFWALPS